MLRGRSAASLDKDFKKILDIVKECSNDVCGGKGLVLQETNEGECWIEEVKKVK